ncbi:hypothetical protein [Halomonas sp. TD01]|uniref:hypothetical protein n=1 Tax=Halomonas sp. TD01 TaxID=999141 RepID=UPI000214F96A|nr:hypothetical protein [Halomonas sp. TD01]EGP19131.1 hypothetical protein GME_12950 [Halomonas sp. TD01]CAH1042412.1 hypothetical protein HPTD01_890 [Halomonas sp. TD01]
MHFYRRKAIIISLVIISIFLAWLSYLLAVERYRPGIKQTQALTTIADQVHAFMQQKNLRGIGVTNEILLPESLRGDSFIDKLPSDITDVNSKIEHVSFSYRCEPKCSFTAYFYFDIVKEFVPITYRYIQYNPNGFQEYTPSHTAKSRLTEFRQYNWADWSEEFVPSIAEALKEDVGYVYTFCEPLEQEHWHFCRGEYD